MGAGLDAYALLDAMMANTDSIQFLQATLPHLGLQWQGFRKVRGQVLKRIKRRLRELGLPDVSAYGAYLECHAEEWGILDGFCHISVSRFYRDKRVFDVVLQEVLVRLAQRVQISQTHVLRCWSAGCASGEEAYTLNLAWHLSLAHRFPDVQLQIIATDASPHMLSRARQGRYAWQSVKDVPPHWIEAGFERHNSDYYVRDAYRDIQFVVQDIRQELPKTHFHLVLCRNLVFTYFATPLQREILSQISARLLSDGILVIGTHESLPPDSPDFVAEADQGALGLYRKVVKPQ
ncbi:MAG: CheR family methyltransferase [Candidatus Tectomicrobia bacterium]